VGDPDDHDAWRARVRPKRGLSTPRRRHPAGKRARHRDRRSHRHEHDLPCSSDNTFATPANCADRSSGGDRHRVQSATSSIGGHGTSIRRPSSWRPARSTGSNGRFPGDQRRTVAGVHRPEFTSRSGCTGTDEDARRDAAATLGARCANQAFLLLQGRETFVAADGSHVENARAVAEFLESHDLGTNVDLPPALHRVDNAARGQSTCRVCGAGLSLDCPVAERRQDLIRGVGPSGPTWPTVGEPDRFRTPPDRRTDSSAKDESGRPAWARGRPARGRHEFRRGNLTWIGAGIRVRRSSAPSGRPGSSARRLHAEQVATAQ